MTPRCSCTHHKISHYNGQSCYYNNCYCKLYSPVSVTQYANDSSGESLVQYTADQLDIPYRVSKAGREYCVYYITTSVVLDVSVKGKLIELVIMGNINDRTRVSTNTTICPWFVTWNTPSTTHKETLAKFTDILMLISLLQEGVNAQKVRKTEAYN